MQAALLAFSPCEGLESEHSIVPIQCSYEPVCYCTESSSKLWNGGEKMADAKTISS